MHGGVFFGHKAESVSRIDGVKTLAEGAKCSVVDWIPKGTPARNQTYSGMRVYGTAMPKPSSFRYGYAGGAEDWNRYDANREPPSPPKTWKIVFYAGNVCELFVDGDKLRSFKCYDNDGFIGFYAYQNCGMVI